jgi:hypothetical protein
MTYGAVELDDPHEYKARIKRELGGNRGLSALLQSHDQTNFDFWVAKDGTVWISDNGEGGKDGVETEVNFFDLWPDLKPEAPNVAAQPDRGFGLDPADVGDEPQPGETYVGDDDVTYYVAQDGISYPVHEDNRGNTYVIGSDGQSHWTGEY